MSSNLALSLEVLAQTQGWGERPAFRYLDRGWTHAEVHHHGHRAARLMATAGVGVGDRVLLVAADRIELVWAFLGAARLGAIAVLVNPLLTGADHGLMARDAAPALVLCEADLAARFSEHAPTVAIDELSRATGENVRAVDVAPETPAYAQYTSGTTGAPKAALHRHSDPSKYHAAMATDVLRLEPEDVLYSVSKAYFAYGLGNSIVFPLFSGCSAVLEPARPTVEQVGELVARHRVTVMFAVPSFYARMISQGDRRLFATVRVAVCAGEMLPPVLYERIRSWLGRDLLDGLGSTEVGQTFISNRPGTCRAGTVGTVLRGYQVEIRDEAGRPLPAGPIGSLWVRGDSVMLGYLNRPATDAATPAGAGVVSGGGWYCTGDRASVAEDGFVQLHGRLDDIEIVGGINVSPMEIEAILLEHPAVVEVAVAAVADEVGATRLRGFAVLGDDVAWSSALEQEILALARGRLSAFKVPRSVAAVAALPRTPTGKLRRHILRAGWPTPTPAPAAVGQ